MCTRFFIEEINEEILSITRSVENSFLADRFRSVLAKPVRVSGEFRPADIAPVIAQNRHGKKKVFPMLWGYTFPNIPHPVVNARVETAGRKPAFQEDWQKHRCIIPASWYFEWAHYPMPDGKTKTGEKYAIQPVGQTSTLLAGLYRFENDLPVFTVLTRKPEGKLAELHDRMPLILPEDAAEDWICPERDPVQIASSALTEMFLERVDGQMTL